MAVADILAYQEGGPMTTTRGLKTISVSVIFHPLREESESVTETTVLKLTLSSVGL